VSSAARYSGGICAERQTAAYCGRHFDSGIAPARYLPDGGARQLRATAVGQTGLTLSWTAPPGAQFRLRRAAGDVPVARRWRGVPVPVNGTSAVDKGRQPGKQYSYSLFTRLRGRWIGALVVVAGTAPPSGSTDASYIAAPTTLLAKPSDIASVTTTGTGVRLVLQGQVPTPPLGAGVVLPISSELPGGFLGVVTAVSADGRALNLEAGGLANAFDYYELSVEEFSADLEPAPDAPAAEAQAKAQASAAAAAAADETCKPSASGPRVNFSRTTTLGGHFKTRSTSTASSAPRCRSGRPWTWG